MTPKILFLHGFFASGACMPAQTLTHYFAGKASVVAPDLPVHPREAVAFIRQLCTRKQPDVLAIGTHTYKSLRADGNQQLTIDQALIDEFADLQQHQWDHCRPENRDKVWGLFGEKDTVAHYEPLFREHYSHIFHFPGAHTPTAEEVTEYYAPLLEQLLGCYTLR